MMTDKRRTSTAEFKRAAVRLVTDQGDAVAEAARHLGLHAHMRRRWTCEVEQTTPGAFPGHGRGSRGPEALPRGRDENTRLRLERAMLKLPL